MRERWNFNTYYIKKRVDYLLSQLWLWLPYWVIPPWRWSLQPTGICNSNSVLIFVGCPLHPVQTLTCWTEPLLYWTHSSPDSSSSAPGWRAIPHHHHMWMCCSSCLYFDTHTSSAFFEDYLLTLLGLWHLTNVSWNGIAASTGQSRLFGETSSKEYEDFIIFVKLQINYSQSSERIE